MTIIEKMTYRSASLPEAPERATRAEAEADEERGVELAAYLKLLPGFSDAQWAKVDATRSAVRKADRAEYAARVAARAAAWSADRVAAWYAAEYAARNAAAAAVRVAAAAAVRVAAAAAVRVAAAALVVRDRITTEQFETLVAPMRAAGIDFDNLGGTP